MGSYKHLYKSCFKDKPNYLHFAAHSHHPWPDCTFAAHEQYWKDSAKHLDQKWDYVFSKIIPETQQNIASILNLSYPENIAIAPNTHEFVVRLFSCLDFSKSTQILTTDSEFHSFRRQLQRFSENPNVTADIVQVEPYETFEKRWCDKIKAKNYDMIFTSHVFFNSGLTCPSFEKWVPLVPPQTLTVVDGYHSFCALTIDLKKFEDKIFFIAGGYKYAQAGEGVCFMSVPPSTQLRPANTGWFASFETLESGSKTVEYSKNGMRFAGSTFDPSGCYRFNAVCEMLKKEKLTVSLVHERVLEIKKYFIEKIKQMKLKNFGVIISENENPTPAHFATFKSLAAAEIQKILEENDIIADYRGDRLRFGFGLYHDLKDVDIVCKKLSGLFGEKSHEALGYEKSAAEGTPKLEPFL